MYHLAFGANKYTYYNHLELHRKDELNFLEGHLKKSSNEDIERLVRRLAILSRPTNRKEKILSQLLKAHIEEISSFLNQSDQEEFSKYDNNSENEEN